MNILQIKEILSKYCVGIAGLGGLGSNCAMALARMDIGKLVLADFDSIDAGNLNRQYYFADQIGMAKSDAIKQNIYRLKSNTRVEALNVKIDKGNLDSVFGNCDILVEAFDLSSEKQFLIEQWMILYPEKPIITGLGMAGYGNTDLIKVKKLGNIYICGDGVSEISFENPPLAPRVAIVANMQANLVLEILMNSNKSNI